MNVTKNDVLLMTGLLGNLNEKTLPLRFNLGGVEYKGIPEEFSPRMRKTRIDSNLTQTVIEGCNAKGLKIRAEVLEYRDFPVCEWQVFFENTSTKATKILCDLMPIDFVFPAKKAELTYSNGETCTAADFETFTKKITKEPFTLASAVGTSCSEAFPYFRITTDSYIASVAVGWSGEWKAQLSKTSRGVSLVAGQKRFSSKILPGEIFCTPRMTVMLTDGTEKSRAVNIWRRWYFKHIIPKEFGQNIPEKSCMHVFNYDGPEFTGATTAKQLEGLESYWNHGIGPDVWWIDAGWYKCDKNWPATGNWEEDKERFPEDGLAPIGKACEKFGSQLLLWFEPERVYPGSRLEVEHPEWLLYLKSIAPSGRWNYDSRLLDLGNEEALNWLIDHVDGLIKKWHIKIYRQDFNHRCPNKIWEDNEAKDRIGAIENKHIQGYWRYWDALIDRNPGLWIDSCAAGGRRNDLETMRRAVPLHYTDVGYGHHPIKQCQHQLHFEWIPYFRAHTNSWDNENGTYDPRVSHKVVDEFAYMNAMTPAITVTTEAWAEEDEFALGRKMLPIWRRAAQMELRGDYYPITQSTKSPEDLFAVEFYDPAKEDGMLYVIRNTLCEKESITVQLHACPDSNYILEDPVSGEIKTVTGAYLANGITVSLEKRSGRILFYKRVIN